LSLHPTAAAPAIDTARLSLRSHRVDDFADSASLWGDPRVTRYIGGRTLTGEEAWTRLLRYIGHWSALGFGYWVARETSSGRFVGEVGLADFRRDIEPPLDGAPEAGWVLAPWAHGQGFATEAVSAVLAWGAAHFGPRRTVCLIHPENVASIRVAEKVGFRVCQHTTYHGEPTILFDRQMQTIASTR
jgi:RimJ/RimL family protein N-acetyltransferase